MIIESRSEQLCFLINQLAPGIIAPDSDKGKWYLFRRLVNEREPQPASDEFLRVQDSLLQALIYEKGITDIASLSPTRRNIYLWRGDITTLKVGAIVNAANNALLGCFIPNHTCIDNAIHTFAGIQLRLECAQIMARQGYAEPTGGAKITRAYNLPSDYILHTVGPIVCGEVSAKDEQLLASCYRACLELAAMNKIESIAFCCISTGVFRYPNKRAAEIAVKTIESLIYGHSIKVVFNVFTEKDYDIYSELLAITNRMEIPL
jgi:O-acetyl-ADP-ribose deacetylase (regulator of RNase III)